MGVVRSKVAADMTVLDGLARWWSRWPLKARAAPASRNMVVARAICSDLRVGVASVAWLRGFALVASTSRLGSLAALSGAAVLRQNATSLQNFAAAMRLMALNCAAAQMMAQRDAGVDEQP